MKAKYVKKDSFDVAGMEKHTTMKNNEHKAEIKKLWDAFMARASEIKNKVNPGVSYGICKSTDASMDNFIYMACIEVSDDKLPSGMKLRNIPASKYAVFTHKGSLEKLDNTYDAIFRKWLPKSKKQLNTEGYDFELYDRRFTNKDDSEFDIYVAIK